MRTILNLAWIPINEEHDWIPIELGWVSWANVPKTNRVGTCIEKMTVVYKIATKNPQAMNLYLLELMAQQSDEWNDEYLQQNIGKN